MFCKLDFVRAQWRRRCHGRKEVTLPLSKTVESWSSNLEHDWRCEFPRAFHVEIVPPRQKVAHEKHHEKQHSNIRLCHSHSHSQLCGTRACVCVWCLKRSRSWQNWRAGRRSLADFFQSTAVTFILWTLRAHSVILSLASFYLSSLLLLSVSSWTHLFLIFTLATIVNTPTPFFILEIAVSKFKFSCSSYESHVEFYTRHKLPPRCDDDSHRYHECCFSLVSLSCCKRQ